MIVVVIGFAAMVSTQLDELKGKLIPQSIPRNRIRYIHRIMYIIDDDNEMRDQSIPTSTNSMLEMHKHYSRATSTSLNASADVPHSLTFALSSSKSFVILLDD